MFKIIKLMFGESKYLETTSPERDIWGQFNPLMANSFFVYLNELSKKQTYEAEHKIKALITDHDIQINIKGKDSFKTCSYHRFGGSSNDSEPINTHATDRRKVLVCASNELMNNIEYFNEINKYIDDVNYIKSFYEYLKSIPNMDKFNKIEKPITEYQKILCELSISPIEAFIKDMITDCNEAELIKTTKELFDMFKEYLHESKTNYEINIIKFGVRLTNLKLNGIETLRGKNSSSKKLDIPILKKHFGIGCLL
jgi:phage/plasmid-associated DNA primase